MFRRTRKFEVGSKIQARRTSVLKLRKAKTT